MLERLDEVPWNRLGHAYGSAEDVPALIRALRSADGAMEARFELAGTIVHQGTRFEAAAHAVPFLLEILAATDSPERADLLGLLTSIAIGYDETWLPGTLPIAEHRRAAEGGAALLADRPEPSPEVEDEDDEEEFYTFLELMSEEDQMRVYAHFAVTSYEAVQAGVPLFRSLLDDPDPAVRTWAAYALAWFGEEAAGSLPALARVPAADAARATAVVAAGLLGGRPDPADLGATSPQVRWAAAVATATVDGPATADAAIAELLTWAGGDSSPDPGIPFRAGDLAGYAAMALRLTGPAHAEERFEALLTRLPSVSGTAALPVVTEALHLAFPDGPMPDGVRHADRPDRQRRLITVLAESPRTWTIDGKSFGNFRSLIRDHGLSDSAEALRAYVVA